MKKIIIIFLLFAAFHLHLSAQIITPVPPTIASTKHFSNFQYQNTVCDLVRFYKDSTIVTCSYNMYESVPTSKFAIIEYGRQSTSTHWYFSLPEHYHVTDMEILDTVCYFCGYFSIGEEYDSIAFVGRFSVEELIRHGNTCSYDISVFYDLNTFTKISVSHVRGNNDLISLSVIGTEIVYSFDPSVPPTYSHVLVLIGNFDMSFAPTYWHCSIARPSNTFSLHFKDVLTTSGLICVSTTYNNRDDAIGVISEQNTCLNSALASIGFLNVMTLPSGSNFYITRPIIMCLDPTNGSNVQLFASMNDGECGYGLYANNFYPQGVLYSYKYIYTGQKLCSPLEAVGLPWRNSFFVTAKQDGTGKHQIYRLLHSFTNDTSDVLLYCPQTNNKSIDRFNGSTFITGGVTTGVSPYSEHTIMSQNEIFYNNSSLSCFDRESTFCVNRNRAENTMVKYVLDNSAITSFQWQQYQAVVNSNVTSIDCLRTAFHFFD